MRNKSISKNSSLTSTWMDGFLAGMAKKFSPEKDNSITKEASKESLAEININDLEKLTWNDETFYVHFDNQDANVLNEFGNVVTTLKGVTTIEDVDSALNSKQVVVSSEERDNEEEIVKESEFQDELNKVVTNLDKKEASDDNLHTNNTPDNVESPAVEKPSIETEDKDETTTTASNIDPNESDEFDEEDAADEDLERDQDVVANNNEDEDEDLFVSALVDGFAELEERLAAMEQQYARVFELIDVSNGSADEEQKHYEETAKTTMEEIEHDNKHDITTPKGRVEISEDHNHVSEGPETTKEDSNNKNSEDNVEEKPDNASDESNDVKKEASGEENLEEDLDDDLEVTGDESDNTNGDTEVLADKDSKIFKHAVCPDCGDQSLTLAKVAGDFQGVYCASCSTEYAVNLNTEEIFKFRN